MILSYLIIILSLPCCGQKDKKETTEQELSSINNSFIPQKNVGRVSDFDSLFSPAEVRYLDSIVNTHELLTTNEIAIVTLHLDSLQIKTSEDFDKFSLLLFQKWGIGIFNQSDFSVT